MSIYSRLNRFFVAACLLMVVALAGGCYKTHRDAKSKWIPPAQDAKLEGLNLEFEQLKTADFQFPNRDEYVIGPGDLIAISLIGRPDLLGQPDPTETGFAVRITEGPNITLPFIGSVRAHGRTAPELEDDLRALYSKLIPNPAPVVEIREFRYNTYAVVGSVRTPGRFQLETGDTVIEAIFKAGGLTFGGATGGLPPARLLKVYRDRITQRERLSLPQKELLQRLTPEGSEVVVPKEEIIIPLDQFLLGGDLSYNIPLQPNDLIFVPPAGTVSVVGNAKRARVVFLGPSVRTFSQVMTEVGGLEYKASTHAEIVRTNPDGTQEFMFIRARDIMRRRAPDIVMQDGDQIFIYRSIHRTILDALGSIFKVTAGGGVSATYSPI